MSELRAIVYVSSATHLMTTPQLERLLTEARARNAVNAVTGVLLYNDGNFMQYIEGLQDDISVTYERIVASKRHQHIISILNQRITQRSFAEWEMGFAQPTKSELLALSTARWQSVESEAARSLATSSGLALLRDFWKRARK